MRLNRIGSTLNRNERNNLNENFDVIEQGFSKVLGDSSEAKEIAEGIDGKASQALATANGADNKSTQALATSDGAMTLAESVRTQFDQIVIEGDSSVEAAQARVSADDTVYSTLKARLDAEKVQVTQQLAQNVIAMNYLKEFAINVKENGAIGDGIAFDSDAFIVCVQAIRNAGGGTLYISKCEAFYNLDKVILGCSNLKLEGDISKPEIKNNSGLPFNLFYFENEENIEVSNLTFRNGTSKTGSYIGNASNNQKCCMSFFNCKNIRIHDTFSHEVDGYTAFSLRKVKNVHFFRNLIKNCTYSMFAIREESEDIYVYQNEFNTVTGLTDNLAYLISTGVSDYTTPYEFGVKNLHIYENKLLNNPHWEGIDTHGCIGFYCHDNYIENVSVGIMCAYDSRPNREFCHGDIYITNNIIKKGNSSNGRNGIVVTGDTENGYLANNVTISGNRIEGSFGNPDSDYVAGLRAFNLINFKIENNIVNGAVNKAFSGAALVDGVIKNNSFIDTHPNSQGQYYAVRLVLACYIVDFERNTIKNINLPRLERGVTSGNGLVNYKDNFIDAVRRYNIGNAQMDGVINNTYKRGKVGTYVKDMYGVIKFVCTDEFIRSVAGTITATVSGLSGSNVLTTSINVLPLLSPGEEIVIVGGGVNGENLTTVLTEFINHSSIKIRDNLSTTITGAPVQTLDSNWIPA